MKKEGSPVVMIVLAVVVLAALVVAWKFGIAPMTGVGQSDKPEPMPASAAAEFQKRLGKSNFTGVQPSGGGAAPAAPAPAAGGGKP